MFKYKHLPKPIGTLILLLLFIPPTFSGGAYLSNASEMVGGLGIWTEDVQMASFFTSIGMCLFAPFMVRFLQARRVKQTYRYCYLALLPLNYICATTTCVPLLLAACLLTGFVRIVVMFNCTFTLAPYLTGMDTLSMFTMREEPSADVQYDLERKRTLLMPVLYGFILAIAQTSNYVTAWFAYEYRWQQAYYVTIAMLLVGLLLVELTMADQPRTVRYKPEWAMVPEMLLMAVALCAMAYVLTFGKTLDWFDSASIRHALALMLAALGLFLLLSTRRQERHYLPLRVLTFRNVWLSMLLFLVAIVFNSASSLITTFARAATPVNSVQSASLSLWAVLGCFLGLALSLVLVVRKVHFRYIFAVAFLLMAAANALMYFQYQRMGLFQNLILPTVVNYTGLLILYSLVAAFGMKHLPSRHLATYVFLMIWMRNAIAPVVGASLYANWLNHATSDFLSRVPADALLRAMQHVTGTTVVLLFATAALTLVLPYRRGERT